ncbi:MAG: ribonuclease Y [Calditrichales bacterium]|nr:MAG: ribonuclease Y [Calditrichales bacterium]
MILIISVVVSAIIFFLLGWFLNTAFGKKSLRNTQAKEKEIISNAQVEAENLKKEKKLEAEEEFYHLKQNLEEEFRNKKKSLQREEQRLNEKDTNIDRKSDYITKKEQELQVAEQELANLQQQNLLTREKLTNTIHEQNLMLEKIAGLKSAEAKQILMDNLVEEARTDAAKTVQKILDDARNDAHNQSRNIVITAIQQSGIDMAIESTVSTVVIPSDDMKGRIIGREGRNIRSFEIVTGVDVIVDDTPGSIILSAFDPLRREIARIVMERLVADGRIHPGRIEDMQEKVRNEMDEHMRELGEQAMLDSGIHGIHHELVYYLGKLRFRTSFGQNALQHSKEVAAIAGIIAAELGLDVSLAKRAGLLHDIGRATDKSTDTNHAEMGADLAKKYNENKIIQNAIAAHHSHIEPISPISVIVQFANELSKNRPGARREAVESFITRMRQIEAIAASFEGVKHSYAIQAGKEVRVIVSHDKVDDQRLNQLAKDISGKIEKEIEYPGQIRVVVIREFRGVDYA